MSALILLLLACVPHLYTDDADSARSCEWTAPENGWYSNDPPQCLEGEGLAEGQVAPDLLGVDQHGDEVRLWQFYGELIVLDLSAVWCGPCQALAATVDDTVEEFAGQGLQYLTLIVSTENAEILPGGEHAAEWSENFDVNQPVIADVEGWHKQLFPTGSTELPRILLIGRDMHVLDSEIWPPNDVSIHGAIEDNI